jgi:hypothetical protein
LISTFSEWNSDLRSEFGCASHWPKTHKQSRPRPSPGSTFFSRPMSADKIWHPLRFSPNFCQQIFNLRLSESQRLFKIYSSRPGSSSYLQSANRGNSIHFIKTYE